MKKILCPIDFSDVSRNAMGYACKVAHQLGGSVTLLNVQSLAEMTPEQALYGEKMNVEAAGKQLEEWAREASTIFRVACYSEVTSVVSSMHKMISARASEFDLIIMGTSGADDVFDSFFGSNTYQVIRKSSIPVMVVPSSCIFSEIRNILYAYDYWHHENVPMNQLLELAKVMGSKVTVLQMTDQPSSRDEEVKLKARQQQILDRYKGEDIQFETVSTTSKSETLGEFLKKTRADLLALCTVQHGFPENLLHKSLIKEISLKADYPLMVFHS